MPQAEITLKNLHWKMQVFFLIFLQIFVTTRFSNESAYFWQRMGKFEQLHYVRCTSTLDHFTLVYYITLDRKVTSDVNMYKAHVFQMTVIICTFGHYNEIKTKLAHSKSYFYKCRSWTILVWLHVSVLYINLLVHILWSLMQLYVEVYTGG